MWSDTDFRSSQTVPAHNMMEHSACIQKHQILVDVHLHKQQSAPLPASLYASLTQPCQGFHQPVIHAGAITQMGPKGAAQGVTGEATKPTAPWCLLRGAFPSSM